MISFVAKRGTPKGGVLLVGQQGYRVLALFVSDFLRYLKGALGAGYNTRIQIAGRHPIISADSL